MICGLLLLLEIDYFWLGAPSLLGVVDFENGLREADLMDVLLVKGCLDERAPWEESGLVQGDQWKLVVQLMCDWVAQCVRVGR